MPRFPRTLVALTALALAACTDDPVRPTGPAPAQPRALVTSEGTRYTQVSAGSKYTCAIQTNGALDCWVTVVKSDEGPFK